MGHVNIEIKARSADHESIRSILESNNADYKGTDHQIDTYFNAQTGRLKIREGDLENYLVFYSRNDQEGPKQSDVTLLEITPGSNLKDILAESLGIMTVVDKKREIYFIDNVKFHLDRVEDLGTFVEIEAIDLEGTLGIEKLQHQCQEYMELLRIKETDLVSCSYSDMMLAKEDKK